jgi:hypothetical protein
MSKTVDPNMTVTTAEDKTSLDAAFDKAFGPLTEIQEPEPEVKEPPVETVEPEPETKEPEPEEPKPEEKGGEPEPESKEPPKHPDDEEDEELDKLRLHPDSHPQTIDAFRNARGAAKQAKRNAKELRERLETQERELAQLKTTVRPVSDPTVQAELDELRIFRTKHQIFDDGTYIAKYEQPVHALFNDIVDDVVKLSPDKEKAEEWAKQLRSVGPDRLDKSYWSEGVINQCPDPLDKERLVKKISGLLDAKGQRDAFREKMANEPNAYEEFRTQQAADYWKEFAAEAEDEAKKVVNSLGEWASPKDPALAKTAAERAACEAHNVVYQQYEAKFKTLLTDVATKGARGQTRVALMAIEGEKAKDDLKTANTRISKLQAELKDAREQLDKIATARARVNTSSGSSSRASEPKKSKLGASVEEAFRDAFGS